MWETCGLRLVALLSVRLAILGTYTVGHFMGTQRVLHTRGGHSRTISMWRPGSDYYEMT